MELLVFWFGTVLFSVTMRTVQSLSLHKDLADAGFKKNNEMMNEMMNKMSYDDEIHYDFSPLKIFIPIYNIFNELSSMMWYMNHRLTIVDQLRMQDKVVEMSNFEKEKYNENPTYLNAILVPFEYESRIHTANHIKYSDEFRKGTIYYDFEDNKKEPTILNATGNLEGLSDEKKKKIIEDKYHEVIVNTIKKEQLIKLREELLKEKEKEEEEEKVKKLIKK